MGLFAFAIVLFVVAAGCVGWYLLAPTKGYKLGAAASTVGVSVLGVLFFILSFVHSVPVKSVGVVTFGGKVEQTLKPGFHMLAPWKHVNILDETIQTTSWGIDGNPCINVRIGGQQTACLKATIQWQIKDSAAANLFNNYDTSSNIQGTITKAVVVREFEQVVNQTMGDYNPIQDVAANSAQGNSQFSTFGPLVQSTMRKDIGNQINVIRVIIPFAQYDTSTQNRLNAIQQQYAETAIANQQIVTNKAQSLANAAIARSVSNSPGVLTAQCYNTVENAIKANYPLPAGFNCVGTGNFAVTGK